MLTEAPAARGELVIEEEFFAPVSHGLIDGLLGQYNRMRARLVEIAATIEGETAGAMSYFLRGTDHRHSYARSCAEVFNVEKAIGVLNADYWQQALSLTDVYNCMPQKRRDEWNKSIEERTCPDFQEDTVRETITQLLDMRSQFLAERVDGIFRRLSGNHVTNSPMGFNQRMIMEWVFNSYGHTNDSQAGAINDLRCVISKFMGRDDPRWNSVNNALQHARHNSGKWFPMDGGSLRVRAYKKGTCHLEVHPDMAWRLNCILAQLHPMAIPSDQRKRPERRSNKDFKPLTRALPFAVLDLLDGMSKSKNRDGQSPNTWITDSYNMDKATKAAKAEAFRILESIGGVRNRMDWFEFDYDAGPVIMEIVMSGGVPDQKSHQFYPTPDRIADIAVAMAAIEPGMSCLEPSAGLGALALKLPEDTVCVELSPLHCRVLAERGRTAITADFLAWSKTSEKFDRVVMNPPFADGRALLHLEAAARVTKPFGRITAVLPASMRDKQPLEGWHGEWSPTFTGEFEGTGVSVAIYTAVRAP